MITAVALMLLTGLTWAGVGVLFGLAPADKNKIGSFFALYGIFYTFFVWLSSCPSAAPAAEVLKLAALIAPSAIGEVIAFLLLKKAMDRGNQGIAWSVVQSSMFVSFLGGVFILKNASSWTQWLGMVLILSSLILFGKAKESGGEKKNDSIYFRYVFIAFSLVGTCQFLRIVPGYMNFSEAALSWRLPLQCPWGMIFWLTVCCIRKNFCPAAVWKFSVPYALVVTVGQIFFYWATDAADKLKITSIVVPVSVGSCIALFALYCAFIRKEKTTVSSWIATGMTISGIALLALR